MIDSKKLPTIEVGDTVVFRTDLEEWKIYSGYMFDRSMIKYSRQGGTVKRLSGTGSFCIGVGYWFPAASVAEVIKPTKELIQNKMSKQSLSELINEINGEAIKVKSNYTIKKDTSSIFAGRVIVNSPDLDISITIGYCPRIEINTKMATDMLDFIVDKLKNQYIAEATNEVV